MSNISISIFTDILSLCGIPTGTAEAIYDSIKQKRREEALSSLFAEIRQGNFSNVDKSEFIGIIAKYQRDALEGTAKNNLKLMAKLITGLNNSNQLTISNFQKFSRILADLTQDEICLLSDLYREIIANPTKDRKDILSEVSSHRIYILYSLLRTGFFVPYDPQNGSISITSNIPQYTTSPLLDELFSYYSWEDIATWDWENQ